MRFLIILLLPILSFAQNNIEGTVYNANTKEPIAFASVSLIKEKIGVNADENGIFKLAINNSIVNDSLIIFCLGYAPLKMALSNFGSNPIKVELNEIVHALKEVVVVNNNFKNNTTLNEFDQFSGSYYGSGSFIAQLAQHFVSPSENAMLKEIKIAKFSIPIIAPQKAIFRIRVYDVDPITKQPTYDLTDQVIELKSTGKVVKLNLEQYKIYIPNKDFFVAIEWLRIPYNANEIKINGKFETKYAPSIGFSKNSAPYMEVWQLGLNNVWGKISSHLITNLAIAVSLKY